MFKKRSSSVKLGAAAGVRRGSEPMAVLRLEEEGFGRAGS